MHAVQLVRCRSTTLSVLSLKIHILIWRYASSQLIKAENEIKFPLFQAVSQGYIKSQHYCSLAADNKEFISVKQWLSNEITIPQLKFHICSISLQIGHLHASILALQQALRKDGFTTAKTKWIILNFKRTCTNKGLLTFTNRLFTSQRSKRN